MNKLSIAFLTAVSIASFGCKKGGGGDMAAKVTDLKNKMCECKDQKCVEGVQVEYTKWAEDSAKNAGKMDEKAAKDIGEATAKMAECAAKVATAAAPAAPAGGDQAAPAGGDQAAAPAGGDQAGGGDLPENCKEYQAAIEALSKCDKVPAAARDAMKQGFDQASAAWANIPAESRDAVAASCKAGADAAKQSLAAMCP
jgi:hypothetical protein